MLPVLAVFGGCAAGTGSAGSILAFCVLDTGSTGVTSISAGIVLPLILLAVLKTAYSSSAVDTAHVEEYSRY